MAIPAEITIPGAVVLPFLAGAVAPALVHRLGRAAAPLLALAPLAIFAALATLIAPVAAGAPVAVRFAWAPDFGIALSFTLDGLSLLFALTISGIGALIVLYSGAYLRGHPHLGRFLGFILAFMGAMLGLVLADDLVLLYAFWELTAVTSFLLIGFDHTRFAARRAAIQALLITIFGGLALLLGAVIVHQLTGAWDLSAIVGQGALRQSALYPLVFGLFAVAAFTKSAQLPFQFWLPNAMEAPTPVSAFLHSAAMVQAGVYLLLRLSPLLAGTPLWTTTLMLFGGATLLWGAVMALRESDLKQMLAQSTVASLGLLVLLIGIGGAGAILAALAYFLTHALYKAGLFLTVGVIDHETGLRDITALGGLRDKMALAFIAAILAGFSMLGLPPAIGYLAKEAMYGALPGGAWPAVLVAIVLVLGNAGLGALALAIAGRPFLGALLPTPKDPEEGPVAMLVGPILLGIVGIGAAILAAWVATTLLAPAVAAVTGDRPAPHFGFSFDLLNPAFGLSLATWALSALLFWRLDGLRTVLRRAAAGDAGFNRAYDALLAGAVLLGGAFTRYWQNGRLNVYTLVLFLVTGLGILAVLLGLGSTPALPEFTALTPPQWGVIVLALAGLATVLGVPSPLVAILALGVQGLAVALLYLLFGAPDLGFTQFMVETLSLVVLALVLARMRLERHGRRALAVVLRDGVVALLVGGGVTLLLLEVLRNPLDARLPDFFNANALALAHGHNVVNVILVDFRGLDTLGEISVVLTSGVAILALIGAARRRAAAAEAENAEGGA